ncbi:MAG: endonuclease/exonuclease/phosphatase [Flavobacteriaceae bacterium]|nr:MAG: endonuclease/exonuclease/phosphatase [Flavobacteriaceae bacterium]
MRAFKYSIILVGLLSFSTLQAQTAVMSFNIRYDSAHDKENRWEFRKMEIVDLIKYYQPDFLGVQEAMPNQAEFLAENLDLYNYIGHGRDGENTNSEGIPLFYNISKFELLTKEIFWLSETPEKASKGWDAAYKRIVVYGVFRNKTTKDTVHIFNCHFDHRGKVARVQSAKLLLESIRKKQLAAKKVIIMGDFNSLPSENPIEILNQQFEDSYKALNYPVYGPIGTYNGFDVKSMLTKRIDYIFTKNIDVESYRSIDDKRKNNLWFSDHLPVFIKLN